MWVPRRRKRTTLAGFLVRMLALFGILTGTLFMLGFLFGYSPSCSDIVASHIHYGKTFFNDVKEELQRLENE